MPHITVKVGKVPGSVREVVLESGATVDDALQAAEMENTGYETTHNGTKIYDDDFDNEVRNGDTIILSKKVRGA
ncbi:MAG: hypothetical protein WC284_17440 [Candidimonas sp.]